MRLRRLFYDRFLIFEMKDVRRVGFISIPGSDDEMAMKVVVVLSAERKATSRGRRW
jgi:hypothetical protein